MSEIAQEHAVDEQIAKARHPDQFDDERWPLAQAAAWIIWRSRDRVAQLLSDIAAERDGCVHVFDVLGEAMRQESVPAGPPEGGVLPFVQAQAELWEQLKRGRVRALGIKVNEATWSQIAPDAWCELDYFYCDNGRSNAIGSFGVKKYFDVTLPRADVLNLWPLIAIAQSKPGLNHRGDLSEDELKQLIRSIAGKDGRIPSQNKCAEKVQEGYPHINRNRIRAGFRQVFPDMKQGRGSRNNCAK